MRNDMNMISPKMEEIQVENITSLDGNHSGGELHELNISPGLNIIPEIEISPDIGDEQDETKEIIENDNITSNGSPNKTATRFKWTKEKSQVAMNLVRHGCKPKLVSVAVGCSLRTAQKFVETVTPKIEGDTYKNYEIRRRGRKSKDVNQRLEAIREVLSRDSTKTQVEIAADLKVSNTTVCRDLKRIGASWREKKIEDQRSSGSNTKRRKKKERQTQKKQ